MKKQLLGAAILLLAIGAQSQNRLSRPAESAVNYAEKFAANYAAATLNTEAPAGTANTTNNNPQPNPAKASSAAINWTKISGSMNIYGVLEISSKPLQYNDELNAVSFVHRKSQTYVPSPVQTNSNSASGVIVAMVSTNCGSNWDSTCVWNNAIYYGRYPQGAIYSAPGNTNIAAAHVVVSGPLTNGSSWVGNFLASKQLDVAQGTGYNNIASTTVNAQQFVPNSGQIGPIGKFDYASYDFTSTDDGVVRTLGQVVADFNATGTGRRYRGARIVKGSYSPGGGVFNWTSDSLIIAPVTISTTPGEAQLFGQPHMAWNESGTVGYVVHIGCRSYTGTVAPENTGFQPIVYKTTNGGQSWSLMPGIDFTQPVFVNKVLNHLQPVITNSNITIPLFNISEGFDVTVDKNDNLHILTTVLGTRSQAPDSLGFIYNFTNADGDLYNYPHVPGMRPYLYDFMETSNGWNVLMVDSMSSEAPGVRKNEDGYNDNPWDAVGGTSNDEKVSSAARLQMSRTPDGNFIIYTWAESDTNFTSSGKKWNSIPNLKARAYDVRLGLVSLNEINLTSSNVFVATNAQMHHTSPKCATVNVSQGIDWTDMTVNMPVTVSNNQNVPLTQELPNDHWYSCAGLNFKFGKVGISENVLTISSLKLFPNPAERYSNISFVLADNAGVELELIDIVGSTQKSMSIEAVTGVNEVSVTTEGLNKGVYFVKLSSGGGQAIRKLIIE